LDKNANPISNAFVELRNIDNIPQKEIIEEAKKSNTLRTNSHGEVRLTYKSTMHDSFGSKECIVFTNYCKSLTGTPTKDEITLYLVVSAEGYKDAKFDYASITYCDIDGITCTTHKDPELILNTYDILLQVSLEPK
jgi:hypothetical protein